MKHNKDELLPLLIRLDFIIGMRLSYLLLVLQNLAVIVFCADKYSRRDFPTGFIFGAGTSAYQVEGATDEDGRTPSVWDTFAREGNYPNGATGDIAADQYHKHKEDVQLMVETGLDAYRFSISWSRLIPNGRGPINPKGLQYYNNLIDELTRHGIEPHVTLYNFDHPQALKMSTADGLAERLYFGAYAEVCFSEFGDRVKYWSTLNEPNALLLLGYDVGVLPPKHCSPPFGFNCTKGNSTYEPYLVAHHALLAHASAAKLYRKKYQSKQHGFIGISVFMSGGIPLTNSTEDAIAAERAKEFVVGVIVNPLVYGDYPEIVKKNAGSRLPRFTNDESEQVKDSFDFLGVIHYYGFLVKDNPNSLKTKDRDFLADMATIMLPTQDNASAYEFPVRPRGMQEVLEYFKQTYGNPPIYVHENGQRTRRSPSLDDTSRVEYLHAYIGALLDGIRNGSNVRGYFAWSFLDLFELLDGYQSSYGLYYVDLDDPDLKRYPKLSAHWYSHFLKGNSVATPDAIIQLKKELATVLNNTTFSSRSQSL